MRINSFFLKLLFIFSILLMTYLYAQYQRKQYYSFGRNSTNESVLKNLPSVNIVNIADGKLINSYDALKGSSGLFVHIWGTWCAPCETEMPEFLKYAQSLNSKGVKFLLIAVNDEEVKVKKFLSRFTIPSNVIIGIDIEGKTMDSFGTLKVPESFLFNAAGKHINKFTGPQEWGQESYQTRLDYWLNFNSLQDRKIETH